MDLQEIPKRMVGNMHEKYSGVLEADEHSINDRSRSPVAPAKRPLNGEAHPRKLLIKRFRTSKARRGALERENGPAGVTGFCNVVERGRPQVGCPCVGAPTW